MYLKVKNGQYVDIESGSVLAVQHSENHDWQVSYRHPSLLSIYAVENGYASKEDAQAALDELMDSEGCLRIQPPATDEEK